MLGEPADREVGGVIVRRPICDNGLRIPTVSPIAMLVVSSNIQSFAMASRLPESPASHPGIAQRLVAWLPGLATLSEYRLSWLHRDAMAGIVLTTMLVPVGIAYAVASGLPGVYGLYATIVPLLAYAIFGPSRILVLGPDSALAAMVGARQFCPTGSHPGSGPHVGSLVVVPDQHDRSAELLMGAWIRSR